MEATPQDVDNAIQQLERLYKSVTGHEAPAGANGGTIPPEREPDAFLGEQIDRMVQTIDTAFGATRQTRTWEPATSLWECEDSYSFCMDLPGIPKAAIRISIARDSIEVSGERPRPAKGEIDMRPVWLERPGGEFKRILALPPDAETDDVSAEMKDGVLEIRVPRSGPGRSVSIQ